MPKKVATKTSFVPKAPKTLVGTVLTVVKHFPRKK